MFTRKAVTVVYFKITGIIQKLCLQFISVKSITGKDKTVGQSHVFCKKKILRFPCSYHYWLYIIATNERGLACLHVNCALDETICIFSQQVWRKYFSALSTFHQKFGRSKIQNVPWVISMEFVLVLGVIVL